jgi:hypothetical protein
MMDVPRRFYLLRQQDKSGVSGLGRVADGVWFASGWVALGWHGAWAVAHPWPSLAAVRSVHGHDGATRIVWLDPDRDGRWVAPDGSPDDWYEVPGRPLADGKPRQEDDPPLRINLPRTGAGTVVPVSPAPRVSGPSSVTSSAGATVAGVADGAAIRLTSGSRHLPRPLRVPEPLGGWAATTGVARGSADATASERQTRPDETRRVHDACGR